MTLLPVLKVARTGYVAVAPARADLKEVGHGFVDWLVAEAPEFRITLDKQRSR